MILEKGKTYKHKTAEGLEVRILRITPEPFDKLLIVELVVTKSAPGLWKLGENASFYHKNIVDFLVPVEDEEEVI